MKENLIVIENIKFQWISSNMSTNCPSPLLIINFKNRASRNIVGGRELPPENNFYGTIIYFFILFCNIISNNDYNFN